MKRTGLYTRVSGRSQEDNTSLDGQLTRLTLEAEKRGYSVVDVASDVGSGGDFNRAGWERILSLARNKQIDVVMFNVLDRSTRGGPDALFVMEYELRSLGVEPVYLDIPADLPESMANVFKTIKAIAAQEEAANIGRRTAQGKLDRARAGSMIVAGRPPYGYTYHSERDHLGRTLRGWYEIDPDQAGVVRQIFVESAEGVSAYAIAERLTAAGVPPQQGGPAWHRRSVQEIIKNPVYAGQLVYNKTQRHKNKYTGQVTYTDRPKEDWVIIPVPEMVSPELWQDANASLKGRRRLKKRKRDYLLSGRIVCTCGARVTSQNGGRDGYYRCTRRPGCDVKPITREEADAGVWERVSAAMQDQGKLLAGFELHRQQAQVNVKTWEIRLEGLERRAADLEKERDGWLELFARGRIDMPALDAKLAGLDRELGRLGSEIQEIKATIARYCPPPEAIQEAMRQFERLVQSGLDNMTFEQRRALLGHLDIQAVLGEDEIGLRGIVSDKLSPCRDVQNISFIFEPVQRKRGPALLTRIMESDYS